MTQAALKHLKATFRRTDGLTQQLVLSLGESALIGRDLTCDCRLEGRKVSRRHCRLSYRPDGRVLIQDDSSHNGTFVSGVRVMESLLEGGELLTVGEWQGSLEWREGAAPRSTTVPAGMAALEPPEEAASAEPAPVTEQEAKVPVRPLPKSAALLDEGFDVLTDPSMGASGQRVGLNDTNIVDMRAVWRWEENGAAKPDDENIRAAPVGDNPIVRRLAESHGNLDFRSFGELPASNADRALANGASFNVDAVALRLVFQVTESLHAAASMEAFLADMSESLCSAARARAVVVLLPDPVSGELIPRTVKNRRADESVHLSRTVIEHAVKGRVAVTTEDAAADERFAGGESVLRFDLKAVLVVPLIREDRAIGAVYLTRDLPFSDTERDLVAALSHMIAVGLERSRLREQIADEAQKRRALERFHAPDVVRRLMMEDKAGLAGPARGDGLFLESLNATVLFCDLSGFTRFCERHAPERVGHLLNLYLGSMTEIVFNHGGTIDKYIGDAIMCIFGAPFMNPDDPLRAVRCAMDMRRTFRRMREAGELGNDYTELDVHIGVNTGKVVAGTVGSSARMEYTALGDTVNLAARLESVAKRGQIVIGPGTAALVREEVPLRSLGEITIKGKREPVEVYEVVDDEVDADDFSDRTEAASQLLWSRSH